MLSDNIPTNPDYKCTVAASFREPTPQELAKEQRDDKARRAALQKQADSQKKANKRTKQESDSNKSETPDSAYEMKRKELRDNVNRASKAYHDEENSRLRSNGKVPSSREKDLRAAMFTAVEAEHAFLFSPENLVKGHVVTTTTTMTLKRSK